MVENIPFKLTRRPIEYTKGNPITEGTYACVVSGVSWGGSRITYDYFLEWRSDSWWYLYGDTPFDGNVKGWIGPLSRKEHV